VDQQTCVLGLGLMGRRAVMRLAEKGHEVVAWNRTALAPADKIANVAALALSPCEAVKGASVVLLFLHDADAVFDVLLHSGAAECLAVDCLIADMGTNSPQAARHVASQLPNSVRFADAPVSGGAKGAEDGALSICLGADNDNSRRGNWKSMQGFKIVHHYTYDAVMLLVEDSYHRLGMNRIDIALIHDVNVAHHGDDFDARFKEAIEGAAPALQELKRAGEIKVIGVGVNEVGPSVQFARNAELDCYMLAGRYSLLEQEGLDDLFPLAEAQGFSFLIAGPFKSGILPSSATPGATHDYRAAPPSVVDKVSKIAAVCARHDTLLAAAAIQFPLGKARVASVVTGAVRPEEIIQNVDLMAQKTPTDLWAELRAEELLSVAAPVHDGPFA